MNSADRSKLTENKDAPGEIKKINDEQTPAEETKPGAAATEEKRPGTKIARRPPPPRREEKKIAAPSTPTSPRTYIKKDIEIPTQQYRNFTSSLTTWKNSLQTMVSGIRELAHPQRDSIFVLEKDSVKEKKQETAKVYLPVDQTLGQTIIDIDQYIRTMNEHTKEVQRTGTTLLESGPILRIYLNVNTGINDLKVGLPNGCWSRFFKSHPGFAAIKLLDDIQKELALTFPSLHELAIEARFGAVKPGHRVLADTRA